MSRENATITISVRVEQATLRKIDELVSHGFYRSRSEFIRESIRRLLLEYMKKRWWT